MVADMRRVLILGGPGAGKTTLAVRLGTQLGLPVIHLDAHFWRAGWRESPRAEWTAQMTALVAMERWVMDGHYARTLALSARAADVIVILAPSAPTSVFRLLRRGLRDRGRQRADLAPDCAEQFPTLSFLREARMFNRTKVPAAIALAASPEVARDDGSRARVVILRSAAEIDRFVAGLSVAAT